MPPWPSSNRWPRWRIVMGMDDSMNVQDLLDHAFGQLAGPAREQAERELAADAALAATFDRLVRAIDQLLDDGRTIAAAPDLARRTLAFVAENRRRRSVLDFVPTRVPFRWA